MAAPEVAIVKRGKPPVAPRATGILYDGELAPIGMGDPFGFSHKVEPSHVANVNRAHPVRVHKNVYTAIPQLQSIAEKFWGRVQRIRYVHTIATPRGVQRTKFAGGADINVPPRGTYAEYATFDGYNGEVIPNGYDYIAR